MTLTDLYSRLRMRIGNPTVDEVPDRHLLDYLQTATEWLASELKFNVTTATSGVTLVANTQEYDLPDAVALMIWVEHNSVRLEPSSTYQWTRDGLDWRNADAGTPKQYAIQGRKIIFYPKPDADAVSDDSTPTFRYVSTGPTLDETGTATNGLGDQEQMLIVHRAAMEYLGQHPSDENAIRFQTQERMLASLLPAARRRAQNPIEDYYPKASVFTRRHGAAR